MCVYYARIGYTKKSIRKYAEQYYDFDYENLRKSNFHDDESCQKTVPQAIYCPLVSNSFDDCLRTAVFIGGDCNTIGRSGRKHRSRAKKLLDIKAPEFVEFYMGAGNFLYISNDLQPAFEKRHRG